MLGRASLAEDAASFWSCVQVTLLLLCVPGAALPPLKLGHSACAMKADEGPCKAIHMRYYFNIQSRECEIFEYGGCHGNENNFLTLEECQKKCVVTGQYPFSYPPIGSSFASVILQPQGRWTLEVKALFSSHSHSNAMPLCSQGLHSVVVIWITLCCAGKHSGFRKINVTF